MEPVRQLRRRKGDLSGLPSWDEEIVYSCALCKLEIRVKYHGRAPSAFCRSCTGRLARLKKQWGYRHGQCKTPVYACWNNTRARCLRPTHANYRDYGGRGIGMCQEWIESFKAFHDWSMANGWQKGLTLDRVDNNGPYSPENCRWVTNQINTQNRRTTKFPLEVVARIKGLAQAGYTFRELKTIWPTLGRTQFDNIRSGEQWTNIVSIPPHPLVIEAIP